ncbi:MAG TPA: hypothetical protein VNV87_11220, partial [Acidimicrobiales bacterium]|nr:hypothetical protein [Acidimicrobiales bacterium]
MTELVGRPARDPLEGFVAKEHASRPGSSESAPTWSDVGYDRAWLTSRLRARQLGRQSAHNYATHLARVARWSVERGATIDTITAAELESYTEQLPKTRASRNELRNALTHYFAITRHPDPPLWTIRVPRRTRMMCRALEDGAARSLEDAAVRREDRKGLAVVIGLYLALRRAEIAALRWSDFHDGWLHVVGKGDVEATIPVHPVVTQYLDRLSNNSPFVFPGRYG